MSTSHKSCVKNGGNLSLSTLFHYLYCIITKEQFQGDPDCPLPCASRIKCVLVIMIHFSDWQDAVKDHRFSK